MVNVACGCDDEHLLLPLCVECLLCGEDGIDELTILRWRDTAHVDKALPLMYAWQDCWFARSQVLRELLRQRHSEAFERVLGRTATAHTSSVSCDLPTYCSSNELGPSFVFR